MSVPQPPNPVKLVIGLFVNDKDLFESVLAGLIKHFGPVDLISPWYVFDFTTYYAPEMGAPLFRRITAFESFVEQEELANIKITTNYLEKQYAKGDRRQVNIDPGYMAQERFVLATGKNFAHRIYIGKGIYADLTLLFQKGDFVSLPWTYPDYAHHDIQAFLRQVRKKYVYDLKQTSRTENG